MYIVINKNHDEDQQAITVQSKINGQLFTYYESEIEHITDKELRIFLKNK